MNKTIDPLEAYRLINNGLCPYGGKCADTGFPTDCQANSTCFCFSSFEEKAEFDALPNIYYYWSPRLKLSLFKSENQLKFFINDLLLFNREGESHGKIPDRDVIISLLNSDNQDLIPRGALEDLKQTLDKLKEPNEQKT